MTSADRLYLSRPTTRYIIEGHFPKTRFTSEKLLELLDQTNWCDIDHHLGETDPKTWRLEIMVPYPYGENPPACPKTDDVEKWLETMGATRIVLITVRATYYTQVKVDAKRDKAKLAHEQRMKKRLEQIHKNLNAAAGHSQALQGYAYVELWQKVHGYKLKESRSKYPCVACGQAPGPGEAYRRVYEVSYYGIDGNGQEQFRSGLMCHDLEACAYRIAVNAHGPTY